jgi:hypothetical protein
MDKIKAQNLVSPYCYYLWSKSKAMNKKSVFTVVKDLLRKMVL